MYVSDKANVVKYQE